MKTDTDVLVVGAGPTGLMLANQLDRELERSHIPRPSFYLLRPDGHVGLAGSRLDATAATRYVSERLHLGRAEVQALGVERSPPHVDFTGAHG